VCDGERTTCGSKMLENFVSVYDATACPGSGRGRRADRKTNMDEFAMGSPRRIRRSARCEPVDETKVPADQAAGLRGSRGGDGSRRLGTDTAAPFASGGILWRRGIEADVRPRLKVRLVALSSSFDQIGPFANSVRTLRGSSR